MRPDSDVDLMVDFAPDAPWSLFDFVNLRDELSTLFNRPVDLIEREGLTNPFRRQSIERDLTVVYAA